MCGIICRTLEKFASCARIGDICRCRISHPNKSPPTSHAVSIGLMSRERVSHNISQKSRECYAYLFRVTLARWQAILFCWIFFSLAAFQCAPLFEVETIVWSGVQSRDCTATENIKTNPCSSTSLKTFLLLFVPFPFRTWSIMAL